jgi:glycosyltransferase involved in cell wall biosynthesis
MHVISGDLWAGAESQAYTFLKALHQTKKYNLISVLFNKGELFERLTSEGINTHLIDEKHFNTLQILWKLIKLIRDSNPDIIHTHEYKSNILAVCSNVILRKRARIVRTLHGLNQAPRDIRYLKSHIALWIDDIVLMHFTDCIVAVSRFLEKELHVKYPGTPIRQINNAVDIPQQPSDSYQAIRSAFGVSPDMLWITTAARLVPVKNIEMLIETVRLLRDMRSKKIKVSIFGDGPLRQYLQSRIRQYDLADIISLYGHHPDIKSIMHAWDVFVLTSESEGLPMSLIEAMSVGVIPICTRVGGIPEVIEEGINGFLIKPGSPDEMSARILQLSKYNEDSLRFLKDNARKTVLEKYSITSSIDKLISLYGD